MSPRQTLLVLAVLTALTAASLVVVRQWLAPPAASDRVREGEAVFWGRGRCSGCHPLGGEGGGLRCPDLGRLPDGSTMSQRAAGRVAGLSAAEYVLQALYEPEAYTTPGYPQRLMPSAADPPIALAEDDILAVAEFLLAEGGGSGLTESLRLASLRQRARTTVHRGPAAGDAARGAEVWARMRCATCHEDSRIAPSLRGIGAMQGTAYLEESIVEPNAVVVRGPGDLYVADDGHTSKMPSYRELLNREELEDLVAWLAAQR